MYVVIENTPGYSPDDDDPATFGDLESAREYLKERVESLCEHIAEGYALDSPPRDVEPNVWWSEDLSEAYVTDPEREHDLGRVFTIQEVEDRPDESDAYVNEPAYGSCVVSLDGRTVGMCDDVDGAFQMLARAMRDSSYWPNVWYVNERGNTTLVEILDYDTGTYRFTDTSYV